MTRDENRIKDWRSTGRRKARRALFEARISFECIECHRTTKEPPKDAPPWFDEIWPVTYRVLTQLQADHESKDLTNNDLDYLAWRCPSHHRIHDNLTGPGETTIGPTTIY